MPRKKQSSSKGTCAYCNAEITSSDATKHLASCPARKTAIEAAESGKGKREALYHLRVQDRENDVFWLHLEIPGSRKLSDIDSYLRAIWLECCGHMSEFSVGGWGSETIAKSHRVDEVFDRGTRLTHIYDFGTESVTFIKAVGTREGKPTKTKPIALMARNKMPECTCIECGKPANWLCMECFIEDQIWGTLCDKHAKTHPHEDYGGPLPLVNSPRLGMCGYDGPAEPPY